MGPDSRVKILFVEQDVSVWPRAEAFFQSQLELVGAHCQVHFRTQLPGRAAGFDVVSLDGRGLISALLERLELQADLRQTAILNLHAEAPGAAFGQVRRLLGRRDQGLQADGLWGFPQSWMAPWFEECLEFPELGLAKVTTQLAPAAAPDRAWPRHSPQAAQRLDQLRPLLA